MYSRFMSFAYITYGPAVKSLTDVMIIVYFIVRSSSIIDDGTNSLGVYIGIINSSQNTTASHYACPHGILWHHTHWEDCEQVFQGHWHHRFKHAHISDVLLVQRSTLDNNILCVVIHCTNIYHRSYTYRTCLFYNVGMWLYQLLLLVCQCGVLERRTSLSIPKHPDNFLTTYCIPWYLTDYSLVIVKVMCYMYTCEWSQANIN